MDQSPRLQALLSYFNTTGMPVTAQAATDMPKPQPLDADIRAFCETLRRGPRPIVLPAALLAKLDLN